MGPRQNNPWLAWTAGVAPGLATALTWPATEGWPLIDRVAAGIAAGLAIFAVVYLVAKARERTGR